MLSPKIARESAIIFVLGSVLAAMPILDLPLVPALRKRVLCVHFPALRCDFPFAFTPRIRTLPRTMSKKNTPAVSKKFAAYPRLNPFGVGKDISAADLIDQSMLAYNGGRLREAAQLLAKKMLPRDGFVGLSLTGALTPAGLGKSCLIPLMKAGFVDWIISTGANLYHDRRWWPRRCARRGRPGLVRCAAASAHPAS